MKVQLDEDSFFSVKETEKDEIYIINFKLKNKQNNSHMFIDFKVNEETLSMMAAALLTVKAKIKRENL